MKKELARSVIAAVAVLALLPMRPTIGLLGGLVRAVYGVHALLHFG